MMESSGEGNAQGVFGCELCGLSTPFSYYGQKPPNTSSIVFLEECYVMKDPFSPEKEKFLVIGSHCSLCRKRVCVGTECGLFYTKRFCMQCIKVHLEEFPQEVQQELIKRKSVQKSDQ
ncbi:cysteine-rich DPF motif domain-containing protein 1 [Polyodon spathula]|nr:cysteine-rich DPF motif domain-containing protein 1 [Polyodon spathula]